LSHPASSATQQAASSNRSLGFKRSPPICQLLVNLVDQKLFLPHLDPAGNTLATKGKVR
jgi:hypothetical protein